MLQIAHVISSITCKDSIAVLLLFRLLSFLVLTPLNCELKHWFQHDQTEFGILGCELKYLGKSGPKNLYN